jgi:hypothetical protein
VAGREAGVATGAAACGSCHASICSGSRKLVVARAGVVVNGHREKERRADAVQRMRREQPRPLAHLLPLHCIALQLVLDWVQMLAISCCNSE